MLPLLTAQELCLGLQARLRARTVDLQGGGRALLALRCAPPVRVPLLQAHLSADLRLAL